MIPDNYEEFGTLLDAISQAKIDDLQESKKNIVANSYTIINLFTVGEHTVYHSIPLVFYVPDRLISTTTRIMLEGLHLLWEHDDNLYDYNFTVSDIKKLELFAKHLEDEVSSESGPSFNLWKHLLPPVLPITMTYIYVIKRHERSYRGTTENEPDFDYLMKEEKLVDIQLERIVLYK